MWVLISYFNPGCAECSMLTVDMTYQKAASTIDGACSKGSVDKAVDIQSGIDKAMNNTETDLMSNASRKRRM